MKIRTQLNIAVAIFGALLFVIFGLMIVTELKIRQLQAQGNLAAKIAEKAGHITYLSNEYLIYRENQYLRRWKSKYSDISANLATLQVDSPDKKELLDHIKANLRRVKEVFDDTVTVLGTTSQIGDSPASAALARTLWSRMGVQSQEMEFSAEKLLRLINEEAARSNQTNSMLVICLVGTFGIYFAASSYLIYRRTLKSLSHLQAGTMIIGSGNLDYLIEEDSDDEIGALCRAFNAMTVKLGSTYGKLENEIAVRKLAEVGLRRAKDELEVRVQERTGELTSALRELRSETEERIQAVEELRKKEQQLIQQSRLAAMGEMLVNISHQWRQPLNVLGMMVQELGLTYKYGAFSEELLHDNIGKVMGIIQHMSQTINDFQNFLSPDQEKSPFKVDQVVSRALGLVEENFRSLGIRIDTSFSGDPEITGYPNEYGQVILNLLNNARDAFLEHPVSDARITVRARAENGKALVTITDNAGGIRQEILGKIFDAYFTTKELGKGTGVGLFLSKNIIEKNMGGRLSVRNVAGGAEFKIEV
jgi:C4-dicarboxylate-specific signal transduction histidine kinase